MCTIYEQQTNDITVDLSNTAGTPPRLVGWRNRGNLKTEWDGAKSVLTMGDQFVDANYTLPPPANNDEGAGFTEVALPDTWALYADVAPVTPSTGSVNAGIVLRNASTILLVHFQIAAPLSLYGLRHDGFTATAEELGVPPASASSRWQVAIDYDETGTRIRLRAHEDAADLDAWTTYRPSASELPGAPDWAGLGVVSEVTVTPAELEIYAMRIQFRETPTRRWTVLADTPKSLPVVVDLLNRKNRAAAFAAWSRDDYAIADSPRTFADYTPTTRI